MLVLATRKNIEDLAEPARFFFLSEPILSCIGVGETGMVSMPGHCGLVDASVGMLGNIALGIRS